jgi:hypothetical protein
MKYMESNSSWTGRTEITLHRSKQTKLLENHEFKARIYGTMPHTQAGAKALHVIQSGEAGRRWRAAASVQTSPREKNAECYDDDLLKLINSNYVIEKTTRKQLARGPS